MRIYTTVADLQRYLDHCRSQGQRIGFAPTMGALHQGHLTLLAQAQQAQEQSICSIFVNPRQFNDKADLEKYPRPIAQDIQKLTQAGCAALFLPSVEEVYPPDWETPIFDFQGMDAHMEGAHRPGHFQGMAQVVHRLLAIVQPDSLYMGQKDYQQFTLVKEMLRQLQWTQVRLVCVPIVREADGLAMSSRNVRLSAEGRQRASQLSQVLFWMQAQGYALPPAELRQQALAQLLALGFEVDYLTITDRDRLEELSQWPAQGGAVVCATVRVDGVRLLDNVLLG